MPPRQAQSPPESDRFPSARHPRETSTLFGLQRAERALLDAYRSDRFPPAWILGGPEGVGKASLAWRFARFILANPDPHAPRVRQAADLSTPADHPAARRLAALSHGDFVLLRREWNDKASRHYSDVRIEDVRRALGLFRRASGEGGWRICLIDSADDLNRSSANALLKLIEEPPPRSLFLIVAHRPATVLVTIRSRCRLLSIDPLAAQDVVDAIAGAGPPWSARPAAEIAEAARLSGGSVRVAMRLLDGETLKAVRLAHRLLAALPQVDWRAATSLANLVGSREAEDSYKAVLDACYDWLDEQARRRQAPAAMAPFAEAWEKIASTARDVEAYNLDRRAFILGIFEDLAEAAPADVA